MTPLSPKDRVPSAEMQLMEQQVKQAIAMCVRDWNDSSSEETLVGIILSMLKRPSTIEQENEILKLRDERDALLKEPEVQPESLVEVAEYLSKGGSVIASRPLRVALGKEFLRLREWYTGLREAISQFKNEVRFANGNKETIWNCSKECERFEKELLISFHSLQ